MGHPQVGWVGHPPPNTEMGVAVANRAVQAKRVYIGQWIVHHVDITVPGLDLSALPLSSLPMFCGSAAVRNQSDV
jgi:hypothetical protein